MNPRKGMKKKKKILRTSMVRSRRSKKSKEEVPIRKKNEFFYKVKS
jgi:hypothetical protein